LFTRKIMTNLISKAKKWTLEQSCSFGALPPSKQHKTNWQTNYVRMYIQCNKIIFLTVIASSGTDNFGTLNHLLCFTNDPNLDRCTGCPFHICDGDHREHNTDTCHTLHAIPVHKLCADLHESGSRGRSSGSYGHRTQHCSHHSRTGSRRRSDLPDTSCHDRGHFCNQPFGTVLLLHKVLQEQLEDTSVQTGIEHIEGPSGRRRLDSAQLLQWCQWHRICGKCTRSKWQTKRSTTISTFFPGNCVLSRKGRPSWWRMMLSWIEVDFAT